jgi:putative RNA 2'-phosphotransferase
MNAQRTTKISKFLSLVLRHEPRKIGIILDEAGWTGVRELLDAMAKFGFPVGEQELLEVLGANDKKRFELSTGNQRIRASQGHSVSVDLGYQASIPPDMLYHGTVGPFLESIRKLGLTRSSPLCLPRCWAAKRRGSRILIESSSLFLIPG